MKTMDPSWVRKFIWEIFIRHLLDRQGHIKGQIQIPFLGTVQVMRSSAWDFCDELEGSYLRRQ